VKQVQDPFEILMHDREEGIHHVATLQRSAESIRLYGFFAEAFNAIAQAVKYIDTVLRKHDQTEERYLFPLLEPHAPESVREMRQNRRELWSAFTRLRDVVEEIEESKVTGSSIHELIEASNAMAQLLRAHLEDEDSILYPLSREKLSPKEYAKLAADIANGTHATA
jgi:hemerythrin-like domain-containing protein